MWHFLSSKDGDHHASIGSREGEAPSKTRFDDSSSNEEEEEESESEEEEKEEEKKIEDIVRTKFEGDAHRALFHVIGTKRNFVHDGKSESDEDEDDENFDSGDDEARTKKTRTMIPTTKNQNQNQKNQKRENY